MILQALASYYERLSQRSDTVTAREGFQKQEIPFIVVIDKCGEFVGLQDTREGDGKAKRARAFLVPRAVKRSSGIDANLLWDNPAYLFGCPKPDKEKDIRKLRQRAKEQHQEFINKARAIFPEPISDKGICALLKFLEKGDFAKVFDHPLWKEIEESGANCSFQLVGETQLICERKDVVDTITRSLAIDNEEKQICLVSGEPDTIRELHAPIKGIWNAQSTGANIISFNLPAFCSYDKKQGFNAPVGRKTEFAYTTALNTLLAKGSRQRIQVGDATAVFWAEKPHGMERWFSEFFREPAKGEEYDYSSIRALYSAPMTGAKPLDEDRTPFYVLGLAPNAARIAVRFWHNGTVGEVAKNIRQHFDDISIAHAPHEPEYLSLFRLLVSTAVLGKAENIQPNLAGDTMKAILTGTPYSQTLLSSTVRRIRAEHEVTYPRAALIKSVIVREGRLSGKSGKEVTMALDRTNVNPGYLMGRLFAVLEQAQERANPGINATIRDRFYGAASSTPVTAFPHLMKLKNHHIAKIENRGMAVNLEKQIGEVMNGITRFPSHLNLNDQGMFAVGYYHQRQDFFTKKVSE